MQIHYIMQLETDSYQFITDEFRHRQNEKSPARGRAFQV